MLRPRAALIAALALAAACLSSPPTWAAMGSIDSDPSSRKQISPTVSPCGDSDHYDSQKPKNINAPVISLPPRGRSGRELPGTIDAHSPYTASYQLLLRLIFEAFTGYTAR